MKYREINCEKINISSEIIKKAEEGDVTAQLELGKALFNANSSKDNLNLAFKYILSSAEQGNMDAQFRLGNLYALGYGTAKNVSESYKWYTKAAIKGYKKALIRIHNLYQQDIKMHCRGQINSEEEKWTSEDFKKENNIRELYEYRLEQNKQLLNGAVEYYTHQFKHYQSSDQKDPAVQLNLAFLYQHGYGTKKYVRWAFELYTLAAEQGQLDAQYNLGRLYQQHTDKKFNYRHAFKWYTKSAQGGNIASQRHLAYFYLKGLATDIDYKTAVNWYTKAAESDDSESQVILGKLYRKGDGVKQDLVTAVKWYALAVRKSNIAAKNCLSQLYQRRMLDNIELKNDIREYITEDSMNSRLCSKLSMDISKLGDSPAFKQINKVAKRALIGDGPAMYGIGIKYYYGNEELTQDKDIGVKWIINATHAKYKDAQLMMADAYRKGDLIGQDYHKASIWYRIASRKKDSYAQNNVGVMYKEGLGVRKDPLEASKWFTWAADQDNSDAQLNLGKLRLHGEGIRKNIAEAIAWFRKSAFQKNIQACHILGDHYLNGGADFKESPKTGLTLLKFAARNGHMVSQMHLVDVYELDYYVKEKMSVHFIEFFTMAADSGNAEAQFKLAILYLGGLFVKQDHIKAYSLFKQARNKNYIPAINLFQTPIQVDPNIKDYTDVRNMFIKVTKKGIDNLAYHVGCLYEFGVGPHFSLKNYVRARKWHQLASIKGDSRSYYHLGVMYECGKGVTKDLVTAKYYYKKAMQKEHCDAFYRLACFYFNECGVTENLFKAFQLYTKASAMGHQKASEILLAFKNGEEIMYYFDSCDEYQEIPVDRKKLVRMLEDATTRGYTRLQYQLGIMYEHKNDHKNALKWFKSASNIGVTDAYYKLGTLYENGKGVEQSFTMASSMYQKATERDHENACYRLGQLYQYGNGVELDYLKAYGFYNKAAEMGHEVASKVLNITLKTKILESGIIEKNFFGISTQEYHDSIKMCEYVAEQGNTDVQFEVGYAYEHNYPEPNYVEAYKWYSMAAANSHMEAMYHLGLFYENGKGVSQDYQKANKLYSRSYQLGSDDALHRLGIIYHHGKGVKVDPAKAIECYILSAKLGNPRYQCELGRLYEEGELFQKSLLEALKWYTTAYLQGHDDIRPKLFTMYKDKPYENFYWEKLVHVLSIAADDNFGLNGDYLYKDYCIINNRLGALFCFGQGTTKDLKKAWEYFSRRYSDESEKEYKITRFLQYDGFNSCEKLIILKKFDEDELFMDRISNEQLYILGMVYYDVIVQTQNGKNKEKEYVPSGHMYQIDSSQRIPTPKQYLKAFHHLQRAADEDYPGALLSLANFYHYCYYIESNREQDEKYIDFTPHNDRDLIESSATPYYTHRKVQDFPKPFEFYEYLERNLSRFPDQSDYEPSKIGEQVQTGFGRLYEYGDGVEQDYRKAKYHYQNLVTGLNMTGYYLMALIYYYGKGISVDYKEALDLFEKASNGFIWQDELVFVYDKEKLYTSTNNWKEKLIYSTKPQREIEGESLYYMGLIYRYGQGVERDEERAQDYFRNALKNGCKRAEIEMKY